MHCSHGWGLMYKPISCPFGIIQPNSSDQPNHKDRFEQRCLDEILHHTRKNEIRFILYYIYIFWRYFKFLHYFSYYSSFLFPPQPNKHSNPNLKNSNSDHCSKGALNFLHLFRSPHLASQVLVDWWHDSWHGRLHT